MEKEKNNPANVKTGIGLKENPKVAAIKNIPDEVILRAIREVIRKDSRRKG